MAYTVKQKSDGDVSGENSVCDRDQNNSIIEVAPKGF